MSTGVIISLAVTWLLFGSLIGMNLYLKKKDWFMFLLTGIVISAIIIILGAIWKPLGFWVPLLFYVCFLLWFNYTYIRPQYIEKKRAKERAKAKAKAAIQASQANEKRYS